MCVANMNPYCVPGFMLQRIQAQKPLYSQESLEKKIHLSDYANKHA